MEKAMAPHSSTLALKIPWIEEPGRLQSMGSLGVDTTELLHFHFSLSCIGEGNGNPLPCSCLENPRDGEAWWAAVYGVAQSRTRLKRLSSSSSSIHTLRGLPGGTSGKESACQCKEISGVGLIPGAGQFPGEESCLENPMDKGAGLPTVHGVTQSWTRLKRLSTHTHTEYTSFIIVPLHKMYVMIPIFLFILSSK